MAEKARDAAGPARAEAVGRQLVDTFAVDGARIVTEGLGEEQPIEKG